MTRSGVRRWTARAIAALLLASGGAGRSAAQSADDALGRAMRDELARSMQQLRLGKFEAPYFIAYRVTDVQWLDASATSGSLLESHEHHDRMLNVELRVGDYTFDNSNFFSPTGSFMVMLGSGGEMPGMLGGGALPLDDDYLAIRRAIWIATDAAYKRAIQTLGAKRAARLNQSHPDTVADFSREAVTHTVDERPSASTTRADAEALVRRLSAVPELARLDASSIALAVATVSTRYVNSEGTTLATTQPLVMLTATASAHAPDGMPLGDRMSIVARSLGGLPAPDEIAARLRALALAIDSLMAAPVLDRYRGPILFEGRAAAELVSEDLAPALVAHRSVGTDVPELGEMIRHAMQGAAPFADRMGSRVLPDFMSVTDDPTLRSYGDEPLLGGYEADDEGVRGRRTVVVDHGILETLLTDRTPVAGVPHSTGNSRGPGVAPSNLLIDAAGGVSAAELRSRLMAMVTKRGLPFGIVVREMGDDASDMDGPGDSFSIGFRPGREDAGRGILRAYRVYPDGCEELVRGARLQGADAEAFKDIAAASSAHVVYDATAEQEDVAALRTAAYFGGQAPPLVSYVVPSLLFGDMALVKETGDTEKPPLSAAPGAAPR